MNELIDDLYLLIKQPSALQSPPCPGCSEMDISTWNRANCSTECEYAAYALSEDPERYPIEEHVIPLVFELTSMRLVKTCWSCEGHLDIDGELWKLPQVSFYTKKAVYSQLLCNYLVNLYCKKKLNYPWIVVLTSYERTWNVTYTIKCDMTRIKKPDIKLMQQDLVEMAKDLSLRIKEDAKTLIKDIRSNKATIETNTVT